MAVQHSQTVTNEMHRKPIRDEAVLVYCSAETKERIRQQKRGGETYDELLRRMADQYDPDSTEATNSSEVTDDGR